MEIIFNDDALIAVNKPPGYFVHRSGLDYHAAQLVMPYLRNLLGHYVYPVHRLDRKTSGVLLLAKNPHVQSLMQKQFRERLIHKTYRAIVRGYTLDSGTIDYPLLSEHGKMQEAVTHYSTLSRGEIQVSSGKFATSRYSLVEIQPETGRTHQIRKHFAHIFHPIIGDRPHGCNKQNRFFLEHFGMNTMLLHANQLTFSHPENGSLVVVAAHPQSEFVRMISALGLSESQVTVLR